MKKLFISALMLAISIDSGAQAAASANPTCELGTNINTKHSLGIIMDSIMRQFAPSILPGLAVALYSEKEGWWAGTAGYASLESKAPMNNCHLQYLQSISKCYMAIEILQLHEQGKIDLDAPMTRYLPAKYSRYITDAGKITVRMLLNHTSGIPEYNENPAFISSFIEHPLNIFSLEDCLKSIEGEALLSVPGSKYLYVNTNYLLLALIADEMTGDHAAYIKKNIFTALGLKNSYYGNDSKYLDGKNLPESYWDVFNIGKPVRISGIQRATVVSTKGDDGIVCTPIDAIKFFKGLMEGKLLKPESMKTMFDFVKDEKGRDRYGMGMISFDLDGVTAYGHGGGGMGAGCMLVYIPSRKTYFFFATNLGVFVESQLVIKAGAMKDAMLAAILK